MTPAVRNDARLAEATRGTITARFPRFAAGCLLPMLVWTIALGLADRRNLPPALATLAVQGAVLAAAHGVIRRRRTSAAVAGIVLVAGVALAASASALFATAARTGEVLGFVLFTHCALAALLFPWGWLPEAVFTAAALAVYGITAPWLRFALPPIELLPVVGIAAGLCVAIAEGHARSWSAMLNRRWSEEAALDALAESRDRYRDITESARDFIWTSDPAGRITYINEAGARILGFAPAELLGRNVDHFIVPGPSGADAAALRAHLAAGGTLPATVVAWHTPQGEIWVEALASAVRDERGTVVGFRGISRDVTERHRAETALREREEQLRRMSARETSIREEERKRLGLDLHEGVCQELVGIGILIESARRRGIPAAADETLARAQGYLRAVGEHLRRRAHELRPLQLPDLGLGECLRTLARGMAGAEMQVTVRVPPDLPRLAEDVEVAVYRVAQEALTNTVRHAGARRVTLTLTNDEARLALEVRDDGCGFDRDTLRLAALGLVAMEERAAALGGRLSVESAPGKGTTVRLECPLARAAA